MLAIHAIDIRRILRFTTYTHALPLVPLDQMEFDPAEDPDGDELGILWLRPRENYPFYLRHRTQTFNQKQTVPKEVAERRLDGDPTDHVVAVAVLRHDIRWHSGFFERRLWQVKSYDAFHGYRPYRNSDGSYTWYDNGGPCESVIPQSIRPNLPCKDGWNDGDHGSLRPWGGCVPMLHRLAFSVVPVRQSTAIPRGMRNGVT